VEVVNLGIPATNSYALVDEADEVIAQHPDAVVIYAGHNEYYGALGVGSTQAVLAAHPALVRLYLRLGRSRLVRAMEVALARLRARGGKDPDQNAPTFMEVLAGDQQIALDGETYRRGEAQFADNLGVLLRKFRDANVRVFIGSQASNLRDQHPFAAPANRVSGGADSVYVAARAGLARGDTATARALFVRARDLDVVRFRAPSAFDGIIRRAAEANGAVYVPVAETFAREAEGNIPGADLFLEHVHPNERGATILARAFFDAIASAGFLGHTAQVSRLRPWPEYTRRMRLTPFDQRIVLLAQRTVTSRWPFVPADSQIDYRRAYRPADLPDTLALMVAAGAAWTPSKLRLAQWYERRGFADSAAAELAGVVRDTPGFAEPWEMLGRALAAAGARDSAADAFGRSLAIRPSASAASAAGALAVQRKDLPAAIALFRQSLSLRPDDPAVLYQLSLCHALAHDVRNARAVARRLRQVAPRYPGLDQWLRLLGESG
jgi:tetratricopeptide (TPR) repeat protein